MAAPPQPQIAIWGVGAMGSLFGAYLSTVAAVTLVGNWQTQIDTVRRSGMTIHHPDGHTTRLHPAISQPPLILPCIDIAIVLVKSHQTDRIAPQLATALRPDGVVITLQNGVGNVERLAQAVGADRATQGVTAQGATMLAPGEVRHAGAGLTHIAALPARVTWIQTGADLLNQAGIETLVTDSADSLIWGKLAANAGLNPLTALLDVPNGGLLEEPRRTRFMVQAAREVEAVAHALGIYLPYPDVADYVTHVAQVTGPNISSMLQDMRRQVPTEINAICGAVMERGARLDIPTPVNAALYQLIRAREKGEVIPPDTVYQTLSQVA